MYEHESVPEPTCEGWWWCIGAGTRLFWVRTAPVHGYLEVEISPGCWQDVRCLGPWTGPVPVPEDKPAPIRVHCPAVVERENELARQFCEAMDKSTLSEDEGEKWGKRLHDTYSGTLFGEHTWKDCAQKPEFCQVALRFRNEVRAECVKPYTRFVAAACALRGYYAQGTIDLDEQEKWKKEFDTAFATLPGEDEPPKLKSYKCPTCGHQDIGTVSFEDFDVDEPPKSESRVNNKSLPRADRGKGRLARIDEHGKVETGFEEDNQDEPPKPKSSNVVNCKRCGSNHSSGAWEIQGTGEYLCFDCSRGDRGAEKKPRVSDKELGFDAIALVLSQRAQDYTTWRETGTVAASKIGAAIRAKLEGE